MTHKQMYSMLNMQMFFFWNNKSLSCTIQQIVKWPFWTFLNKMYSHPFPTHLGSSLAYQKENDGNPQLNIERI